MDKDELEDDLSDEWKTLLCLQRVTVDPQSHSEHAAILENLYFNLSDQKLDTVDENNMKSDQWLSVGFLSDDPVSEFRSMGLVGALMLYYLSENERSMIEEFKIVIEKRNMVWDLNWLECVSLAYILTRIYHSVWHCCIYRRCHLIV